MVHVMPSVHVGAKQESVWAGLGTALATARFISDVLVLLFGGQLFVGTPLTG